jgi:toxin ParE1/3/4
VATFRLSRLAEADLTDIGAYTLQTWGADQALRYIDGLETCCRQLADNPQSGRPCDHIRPGLRRMEHARHVVFYRVETGASWYLAFFISACCPKNGPSARRSRDLTPNDALNCVLE